MGGHPVRVYLMTRGRPRPLDYDFLGRTPTSHWWDPITAGGWMLLEYPEVAVHGEAGAVGLLVSGVPSARRDIIGTAIRYRLVVEDAADDPDLALWLIRTGLDTTRREALGAALDVHFDQKTVDAILGRTSDIDADAIELSLIEALNEAMRDAPLAGAGLAGAGLADTGLADTGLADTGKSLRSGDDVAGSWVGSVADRDAQAAFVARAAAVVAGAPGLCFTSHSLASLSGAERARDDVPSPVAILLHDTDLDGIHPLGKVLAPRPGAKSRLSPKHVPRPVLAVILVLAVAVLIRWLRKHR
jgi:hypothetical protein